MFIIAALYGGINFLRGKDFFSRDVTYYAFYDQITDLAVSAPVFIKGVRVGLVNKITYNPSVSDEITVKLNIKPKYRLPKDSKAVLFSTGFMSGRAVRIDLGSSQEYLNEGDTLISAFGRDIIDVATTEIGYFKDLISDLTTNLNTTLGSLNTILADNTGSITSTMDNVKAITGNLNSLVASERQNLQATMANINHISATLKNSSVGFSNIVDNVDTLVDSLNRARIPQMVSGLNDAVGKLNLTLDNINDGKGSLGLLVNDRVLYDSLTRTVVDLQLLLEDIRKNPKRYVHVSVF